MSPSSSRSEGPSRAPGAEPLFAGVLARGPVAEVVSSTGWLRAMLRVEAALSAAQAEAGLISEQAARVIAAACADPGRYDVEQLGRDAAAAGTPVVPLVRAIEAAAGPLAAGAVHRGATSQDVLDTAAMLVAGEALTAVHRDLVAAADAAAALAQRHRETVQAGRTLLQQALPTTFGLTAAGWASGLDGAALRVRAVRGALPVQFGGAVGTLAGLDGKGRTLRAAVADALGLADPELSWHTVRLPVADLAGSLATASGIVGKVALDVVLLAQTEVGEVREGVTGRGGSSVMPHKHNPVAAVSARAAALRAPGLAATLYAAMAQEHQRAAGAWHAEWQTLSDLLAGTGSAAAWLQDCLGHLEVDPDRMRANLAVSRDAAAAERVARTLAPDLGGGPAHELVARVAGTAAPGALLDALAAEPEVARRLTAERLHGSPGDQPDVGDAVALVDRVLAARTAAAAMTR